MHSVSRNCEQINGQQQMTMTIAPPIISRSVADVEACLVHGPSVDVLDLVFEVASIVVNELPCGVTAFGDFLLNEVATKKTFPTLPESIVHVVTPTQIEFISALRANYMFRLIMHAFGDRNVRMNSTGLKNNPQDGFRNATTSVRLKTLFPKFGKLIQKADSFCAESDAAQLSAVWGPMVSDLVCEGHIDEKSIVATVPVDDPSKPKSNAAAKGPSIPEKTPSSSDTSSKSFSLVEFDKLLHYGCDKEPGSTPLTSPMIMSADEAVRLRFAVQQDMMWRALYQ